ncbi:hypothetical protein ACFOQM_11045 [Paenibacillus sp. GCM10012307]|uniref:Uncharacterized protein n=1 Tax=Paenibacillus roseus TaxID=2798579 RepID=A0A934J7H7_9BACL|nr:hypothetical protein [Paenibacillus roseus]MBJ6361822.1 hypothetical protein [Paenibacillus roseus]
MNTLNEIQIAVMKEFPMLENKLEELLKSGEYRIVSFQYDNVSTANHETVKITLKKGYERFLLTQGKGHYAGGYSHGVFGREGERGELF